MLRMLARASALLLALGPMSPLVSSPVPPRPAEERVSLYCARGAGEYPDAELTLSASGPYVMNMVYVGFRPSRGRAEWTVRDCLRTRAGWTARGRSSPRSGFASARALRRAS